jgi:predicted DNA-binding ribbon-helix-helix protein
MSTITHPVELPENLYKKLEDKATNEGSSLAELIEKVLSEYAELPVFTSAPNVNGQKPIQMELTPEEKAQSLQILTEMEQFAYEMGEKLGGRTVDSVQIMREERS